MLARTACTGAHCALGFLGMRGEALKGHLDGMLLASLAAGPAHGYMVIESLREASGGTFDLPEGTVYPALHRLERSGLIVAKWETSSTNRRARYYRLTSAGRKRLAVERSRWEQMAAAISRVMRPA